MATPQLTFKCKLEEDGQLSITIISCANLDDLDLGGSFNLSDPYVVVKVGEEKQVEHDLVAERMSRVKVHLIKTVDKQTAHVG